MVCFTFLNKKYFYCIKLFFNFKYILFIYIKFGSHLLLTFFQSQTLHVVSKYHENNLKYKYIFNC